MTVPAKAFSGSVRRLLAAAIAAACLICITPVLQAGTVTFFLTRATFDAAQPGLPVEGFDNANVIPGAILVESSPISSLTSDSIFSPGSMLPGMVVSNLGALNTPGLIVYGDGALSGGTKSVGTNWFGDTLVLTFASGVSAVGTDVFAATSPGQTLAGNFTAAVYNGSTLLGAMSFSEAKGAFGFIGVSSATPITSMNLLYTTNDATTFVDNIAFDAGAAPAAAPEPSTIVVSGFAAVLLGFPALCRKIKRPSLSSPFGCDR